MYSKNKYLDWYLQLGDMLCVCKDMYDAEDESENKDDMLLMPILSTLHKDTIHRKVSKYFTDMSKDTKNKKYINYVVKSLPSAASGGGIRTGHVNELLPAIPEHFICISTGHDRRGNSAMFEYFTPEFSGLRPSGLIVGGDEPPVYGRLGYPRVPPTLKAIESRIANSVVQDMVDKLYNITKYTHWTFHRDGTLRTALETSLATQIMVFEEREKKVR